MHKPFMSYKEHHLACDFCKKAEKIKWEAARAASHYINYIYRKV